MEKSMDPEMIRKIDSVLDRVKEPESNLSVAELGIIQKLRYNESKRALYIFANTYGSRKACCYLITKLIESDVMNRVKNELKKEFPELAIRFV
jgi:metal-sulfur cluster biosynthetic enzyme